jgi:beta-lactamase superfamily II metal-dependent hydrolase
MKLTIFQSDKGDCLLLEAKTKQLVLCDGGMGTSMRNEVRGELAKLREQDRELEFAYISHIDADHINGVLQLLEDEVEWRVFELHKDDPEPTRRPKFDRPPVIKGILHNGFRDQLKVNGGPLKDEITAAEIEQMLTATAPALSGTAVPELMTLADEMQAIATGIPESLKVARLTAADALNIPLNKPPGVRRASRLLFAGRPGDRFTLGSMKFTLLGPTEDELEKLRKGWVHWLQNNQKRLKEIQRELKKRLDDFSTGALTGSPFDLRDWEGIPDIKGVTIPNIASLMFMVEEGRKKLLLTGDAQQDFILAGLERTGFLNGDDDHLHVTVLKVQHHGSENNMDDNFAGKVSADHYVFCGNGEHENPDLRVLDIVFRSRKNDDKKFDFWFSTTADAQDEASVRRKHFEKVEERARKLQAESDGRLTLHFNDQVGIELPI